MKSQRTEDGKKYKCSPQLIQPSVHTQKHTHTHVRPQSPETWLREQSYRSVGWQARMDEQAGLQEHQRTASVPPNPHATPPNHPRQSRESAGATGKKARAATRRLQRSSRGSNSNWRARVVWSNQSTVLCVCSGEHQGRVSVLTWCTHRRGRGRWWLFPGLNSMEYSCPWTVSSSPFCLSLSHTQTHTHSAHVCQSVVEEVVCRWLLIGPQGPGGWVMGDTDETVCVFEIQTVFVTKVMVQRS